MSIMIAVMLSSCKKILKTRVFPQSDDSKRAAWDNDVRIFICGLFVGGAWLEAIR